MGLIVNFSSGTVEGLSAPGQFGYVPVKITGANEVTVSFDGSVRTNLGSDSSISGSIDRVTGDVEAYQRLTDSKTGKAISSTTYALTCRPTQRMF
jgi:hypothetical protein